MYATFERFDLILTEAQAQSAAHSGSCDADVAELLRNPKIRRQFLAISPDTLRAELREFGAWDDDELKDDAQNKARILWIAAGNIVESRR